MSDVDIGRIVEMVIAVVAVVGGLIGLAYGLTHDLPNGGDQDR